MKKILLHICCGVCALYCIDHLKSQGFKVTGLFFNPNIHPKEEHDKRYETLKKVVEITKIELLPVTYNPEPWFKLCQEYENEPEGGKRCQLCYKLRLSETYDYFKKEIFDFFTTTLPISPHKNSKEIAALGKEIGQDKFIFYDFKKNNGFKKTIILSKQYNLYCQNYCGCIYSKR